MRARPGRLLVGTSGFAYPSWIPRFYEPGRASRKLLAAYAARLPAVELNNTFYRRPDPAAVARWRALTPATFRFCPKAQRSATWRAWTPDAVEEAMTWLKGSAEPFGEQLGCVLLAAPGNKQRDDAALARLLEARPTEVPLALALPHPSWAADEVHAQLDRHGVALVATDRDGDDEPDLRRIGPFLYVRLRRVSYADHDLDRWARRLEPFLADGVDAHVFFGHDEDGTSALRAEGLMKRLAGFMAPRPGGGTINAPRHIRSFDQEDLMASEAQQAVVSDLQATLVELIDLSLLGKQAHWNVVGPNFRSIHLQLDEIVDTARLASDRVAERIATLGAAPEGRSSAVATASQLPEFPAGQVHVEETVQRIGSTIDTMSERIRERILRVGETDPVSQDALIEASDQLEKQAWMLRAQLER